MMKRIHCLAFILLATTALNVTAQSVTERYYGNLEDFHLTSEETGSLPKNSLIKVEAISHKYEITITLSDGKKVSIDESGQLRGF